MLDDMSTSTNIPNIRHSETGAAGDDEQQRRRIRRVLDRKSFAVLSTVSPAGFPHAAGVLYDNDGLRLYVHTMRSSRKARNVEANARAAVVVPVRRAPVGPPFTVQFQASARLVAMDDAVIVDLLARRSLATVSGHGALDEPDGCFIELSPIGRIHSYGIGVSMLAVARDPLHSGDRVVEITDADHAQR
jgi:general stress protein 26